MIRATSAVFVTASGLFVATSALAQAPKAAPTPAPAAASAPATAAPAPAAAPAAATPAPADPASPGPVDPAAAPPPPPGATAAPATGAAPSQPAPNPGAAVSTSAPYDGPPLLFTPGPGKPKLGAYGGLGVAYTRMLHRDGVVVDLSGAILVDHSLSLGLAGYFFSRTPSGPSYFLTPREYRASYFGAFVRYHLYGDFPLYASVGALVGGGLLWLGEDLGHDHHDEYDDGASEVRGNFVFQPDFSLHVNATRWLRFTMTGGYRVATAVSDFGYDSQAMSGVVAGGKVELGWF